MVLITKNLVEALGLHIPGCSKSKSCSENGKGTKSHKYSSRNGCSTICRSSGFLLCAVFLLFNMSSSWLYFYHITGIAPGKIRPYSWMYGPSYTDPNPKIEDYVVVVSMAMNETNNIVEWIEHHKSIGVDLIILYDDTPRNPQTQQWHNVKKNNLTQYVESGFLEIHDATKWDNKSFVLSSDYSIEQRNYKKYSQPFFFDKQQKMQIQMWRRFSHEVVSNRHVWLAQVDIDEMYNPISTDLKQLLRRVRIQGAQAVRVVKQEFGPNGHITPPKGGLRRNYLLREKLGFKHTGLALASAITGMASGCPHIYVTSSLLADLLRGTHECNDWVGERYPGKIVRGVYYSPNNEMVINHYQTMSFQGNQPKANTHTHQDKANTNTPSYPTPNTPSYPNTPTNTPTYHDN
ncbi:hypothetical protein AAMO2058_001717100 [Amorphochlora amoebiformis]